MCRYWFMFRMLFLTTKMIFRIWIIEIEVLGLISTEDEVKSYNTMESDKVTYIRVWHISHAWFLTHRCPWASPTIFFRRPCLTSGESKKWQFGQRIDEQLLGNKDNELPRCKWVADTAPHSAMCIPWFLMSYRGIPVRVFSTEGS